MKELYEFKFYRDGSFKVTELKTGRLGMFTAECMPKAGPLCLEEKVMYAVLTTFSDVSLPGTFIREVELEESI